MKYSGTFLSILIMFCVISCSTESKNELKKYSYSYDSESSILEWTAFKFTERAGVKGTFNELLVSGIDSSEDPKELIESLSFTIPTNTVETMDPERNENIVNYFFKGIQTDEIIGKIVELKADGNAVLELTLNKITQLVVGKYTLSGNFFTLKTTIDVIDWNAKSAIDALNKQCALNHTGTDGILKLWSEVEISFTTKLAQKELN